MVPNDLTMGKHVDGKEERSERRGLRHALVDWGQGGTGVSDGNKPVFCWRHKTGTRRELHR